MENLALFMEWQSLFHSKRELIALGAARLALHSQVKRQAQENRARMLIPALPLSTPFWEL